MTADTIILWQNKNFCLVLSLYLQTDLKYLNRINENDEKLSSGPHLWVVSEIRKVYNK